MEGSNPGLPHCRQILHQLSHQGSPGILEWVSYPFSSRSSWPRNWTRVSCTAGRFFTSWATREAQEYWSGYPIPSPADLPDPRIELGSPALQADSFTYWAIREAKIAKWGKLFSNTYFSFCFQAFPFISVGSDPAQVSSPKQNYVCNKKLNGLETILILFSWEIQVILEMGFIVFGLSYFSHSAKIFFPKE